MGRRAEVLADRIEQGARELAEFATSLSDSDWRTVVPHDGRTVGVVVHHVASVYPIEVDLALKLAEGEAIEGVTSDAIAEMNANHARDHAAATPAEALELLAANSSTAAQRVRSLTDEQLDRAAPVSLNGDAPLTAQFFIEDHALRHSWHHLEILRRTLGR